jgi:hypothetical protein
MRTIKKNSAHRTTSIQRLNDERNKMARGCDEMRRKSEASDEIWKRGYNLKPTKERSGESRGVAVHLKSNWREGVWIQTLLIETCTYFTCYIVYICT